MASPYHSCRLDFHIYNFQCNKKNLMILNGVSMTHVVLEAKGCPLSQNFLPRTEHPSVAQLQGGRGGSCPLPPGSILALKKCTFSYDAINVKNFFWTENLRFQNSCPPPRKVLPPLEIFLATPLTCFLVQCILHQSLQDCIYHEVSSW